MTPGHTGASEHARVGGDVCAMQGVRVPRIGTQGALPSAIEPVPPEALLLLLLLEEEEEWEGPPSL